MSKLGAMAATRILSDTVSMSLYSDGAWDRDGLLVDVDVLRLHFCVCRLDLGPMRLARTATVAELHHVTILSTSTEENSI